MESQRSRDRRGEAELTFVIERTFRTKIIAREDVKVFRRRIETTDDLRTALGEALVEVQSRLMRSRTLEVLRSLPPGGPARTPIISGPRVG